MIILNPQKNTSSQLMNYYIILPLFHWKREMSVERRNESQKKGGRIPQF
jgi:riboflavin transporter FmnP